MLITIASLVLVLTPTNTIIKQPLDLILPKGPTNLFVAEQQAAIAATDKAFIFTKDIPGILSMNTTDIGNRDLSISKLPDLVSVGPRSLFYMKANSRSDFIFTDNSRTRLFYGTTTSGYPVVNRIACGPFSEISDIHLTENSGTTNFAVVADKAANKVYTYVLDTSSSSSLCTSEQSASVTRPIWIQSLSGASPTIYIGYNDTTGLKLRSYDSNMSPTAAAITITTASRAEYSRPIFDTTSSELLIPVKRADDSVGRDYIVKYDSALSTRTNILTCRSPEQIQTDFEGASRYRYVFCPTSSQIQVFTLADAVAFTLTTSTNPRKIFVGSDGTTRFVSVLQNDPRLVIHTIPVASPSLPVTTTMNLPVAMTDIIQMIGSGVAADRALLVSATGNSISIVNQNTAAVSDTLSLPNSISAIAAQSYTVAHFTSAAVNMAYTLTEIASMVWTMRFFSVGTYPTHIGYRTNRLYTLNRDSNNISIVNLTSRAVTQIATGTRPVSMDFDTTTDRLWTANETSQNISIFDITTGSEAVLGASPVALGFTPKKLRYQSSDSTLYVGGGTTVRAIDRSTLGTVVTQTMSSNFADMVLSTGGVTISSLNGLSLTAMTRSTFTSASTSSPPHLLVSSGSTALAGLQKENTVTTYAGLSQVTRDAFSRLHSNASNAFAYFPDDPSLYVMPYSLFSSRNFPGFRIKVDLEPQLSAYDSSGNTWFADSSRLKVQRLSSNLQKMVLANALLNRPESITKWDAQDKVYVALRNLNSIAIVNGTTSAVSYYSVCESPRQVLLESSQSPAKLFVLCTDSDSISIITLTAAGAFSSQAIIATDRYPVSMVLNPSTTNRLYVVNMKSDTLTTYNTLTNALVSRTSVHEEPRDIALNTANGKIAIVHQSSKYLTQITSAGVSTDTDTGSQGLTKIAVNPTTGTLFSINPSTKAVVVNPTAIFTASGTLTADSEHPLNVSVNSGTSKAYITFPEIDTVRIDNEAGTQKDVAVGSYPFIALPVTAASKVFVSNYNADTLSVIGTATDTVSATITLTSGCSPTQMDTMDVGGTLFLYILCQQNDSIEVVNTSSNAVGTPVSLRISN